MARYVESAADMSKDYSPTCAQYLRTFRPLFAVVLQVLLWVVQLYAALYAYAYSFLKMLPASELQMIVGLALCFFGGTYVTLIAAVEAFRTMGGNQLYKDLEYVGEQIERWKAEHAKDELEDADGDGVADVDQIPAGDLWKRKLQLFMKAVDEPAELQSAIGSLWSACLGVLACLMFKFAQTVGYALAISEMIGPTVCYLWAPALAWALPEDLGHWCETIITTSVRVICVLLVWLLEKAKAAFYSGIRGGRLFADALIDILEQRGLTAKLPDYLVSRPYVAEESHLDEIIAYPLAVLGIAFQVSWFFTVPFPLDLLLWPISMAETFLELQTSWSWSAGTMPAV